jgi:predicted pyridoxine 5'-phosphate oxidase superfamily flavin-nucleotide-binding protein
MAGEMPVAELHTGFSSPAATPTDWAEGRRHIDEAEVFWLSTVRRDGRPHVTPCWPCGTTTRCTFARVRTSARQRT